MTAGHPETVAGGPAGLSQQRLELGEGLIDGIEVGAVGQPVEQLGLLVFDRLRMPATLRQGKVSMTTISPGLKVGARMCST